jgi:hypothetical protein
MIISCQIHNIPAGNIRAPAGKKTPCPLPPTIFLEKKNLSGFQIFIQLNVFGLFLFLIGIFWSLAFFVLAISIAFKVGYTYQHH